MSIKQGKGGEMNEEPTEMAPTVLGPQPSQPELAYSDEQPTLDYEEHKTASRRRVIVMAAGILTVAGLIAGAVLLSHDWNPAPSPVAAPTPVPPVDEPTNAQDKRFMDNLHTLGVPVTDWHYYTDYAKNACKISREGEPPGDYGFNVLKESIRMSEPSWTTPQVFNYAAGVYSEYCPEMWGPTTEQLAAMPDDQRLIALLGSKAGLMPAKDDSYVNASKSICSALRGGRGTADVTQSVQSGNASKAGWKYETSKSVVEVAVEVYCPDQTGR